MWKKEFLFYNFVIIFYIYAMGAGIVFERLSYMSYFIGVLFSSYVIYYNSRFVKARRVDKYIYLYLFFLAILILFSSNIIYSSKIYLKVLIQFLFFPIASSIVRDWKSLKRINGSMLVLMLLYLVNLLLANIFDLGGMSYENEETLDVGNIYKTGLNAMAYVLVLIPLILSTNFHGKSKLIKSIFYVLSVAVFLTILVLLKRGALLSIIFGYMVIGFFWLRGKKMRLVFQLIILSTTFLISYPIYNNMLKQRIEVREERLQIDSFETEGRYLESMIVIDEIIDFENPIRALFGHELFNSPGNYAGGRWGDRQLHNDYANLLNGSGLVGISLFFIVNIIILKYYISLRSRLKKFKLITPELDRLLSASFFALFSMYFVMALSGSIDGMLYSGIRYIYLGSIIGFYEGILVSNNIRLKRIISFKD